MKKKIVLIILLAAAAIIGNFIGNVCNGVTYFNWLSFAKTIGISPFTINVVSIDLTFGFHINLSIAQIICLLIAILFYPRILKHLD